MGCACGGSATKTKHSKYQVEKPKNSNEFDNNAIISNDSELSEEDNNQSSEIQVSPEQEVKKNESNLTPIDKAESISELIPQNEEILNSNLMQTTILPGQISTQQGKRSKTIKIRR